MVYASHFHKLFFASLLDPGQTIVRWSLTRLTYPIMSRAAKYQPKKVAHKGPLTFTFTILNVNVNEPEGILLVIFIGIK